MTPPRPVPRAALPLTLTVALLGCATAPTTQLEREDLKASALQSLGQLKAVDPTLEPRVLDRAYGYAIFPEVGKGGYGIGGAYGRGIVYRQGTPTGYADISKATIGFQVGAQVYAELLAFEDAAAFDRFTRGSFTLSAEVSAVILKSGAAESAKYADGVAVFVRPIGGVMVEAAIGGQQFTYQPM
jgi:lipid-binding SYLF domain-containing protein